MTVLLIKPKWALCKSNFCMEQGTQKALKAFNADQLKKKQLKHGQCLFPIGLLLSAEFCVSITKILKLVISGGRGGIGHE